MIGLFEVLGKDKLTLYYILAFMIGVYIGLLLGAFLLWTWFNDAFGETIKNLKAENARLKESFQCATGEIAADPLPRATVDRKRFNDAANEIGKNDEWTDIDKMMLAVFVNELDEKLFGGAK